MAEKLSRARSLAYACGSPGFQISDRIVVAILFYFYLPPGDSGLPPLLSREIVLGGVTAFGAAMMVGRIFDSLADPVVGYLSDRSRSRLGRRRSFLLIGIVPMCLVPVLAFWPPGQPGSRENWLFLSTLLTVYFIFFTVYVAPYLALLPEIARSERERVSLATLSGAISLPIAGLFGFAWTAGVELGTAQGLSATTSIRIVVVVASLVGLVLCAIPILTIDERRFAASEPSRLALRAALGETLRNRPFSIYLCAQVFFIFGINLLQPAIPYFAQVLLGRSIGFAAWLGAGLFVGILVGFLVVRPLTNRLGPKRAMMVCVASFGCGLGLMGFVQPDVPGGPHDAINLVVVMSGMVLSGIPVTGFVILPAVLLSQIIDADEAKTGANRSAIYFGIQGLATKWVYGASTAALAGLLARFGNSQAEPLGVWLAAPIAAFACLLSAAIYAIYPEREVIARAARES